VFSCIVKPVSENYQVAEDDLPLKDVETSHVETSHQSDSAYQSSDQHTYVNGGDQSLLQLCSRQQYSCVVSVCVSACCLVAMLSSIS